MDLFGPLKTSNSGKKFVLCLTDAFTKYAVMLAIDNKEAITVAKHIFDSWICKFGTPLEFVSDNGKEFCNNLAKELYALLKIKHSTTTPYWPQCNSQAEVANKTIQKYLASFVDATTLDWPVYMAPMAFAYNTSVHRSIKTTPFFLTHGVEPRYPSFPNPDVQRYYGESQAAEWYNTLQHCRQIAVQHSLGATATAEQGYNVTAQQHKFTQGQMVWLNETNYLGRNRKLSPNWTGPHLIIKVLEHGVVELLFKNRRLRVNVGRIKPVTPALPEQQQLPNDATPASSQNGRETQQHPAQQRDPSPYRARDDPFPHAALLPQLLQPPPPPPPPQQQPPIQQQLPQVKRGRGRPRKDANAQQQPLPPAPPAPDAQQPQPPPQPQPEIEGPLTRARARALERQHLKPSDAIKLIRRVHLAAVSHQFKPTPHFDVSEGPSIVSDEYNLPKQFPGQKQPQHIIRRRNFLKKLSPQQRNLLLTGDPVFAFDPLAYHIAFFAPQVPEVIQQQFDYIVPDNVELAPQPVPEVQPESPPPSPPPQTPPGTPPAPIKRVQIREQLIKPQLWPDPVAASPYVVDVTSPSATQRWMRSSTSGTPPYLQPSPPASGWGDFVKKTRNVAADLLNVPPPGWKPPKQPQPHRPPPPVPRQPSVIRRVASQIRNELLNPPQPFPQQPRPAKPTGTKPKQTR